MPKIKTHRASAKRFRVTKNGKVKMNHAFTSHILTKKSTKRKRGLRGVAYANYYKEQISRIQTMEDIYRIAKGIRMDLQ